LTRKVALYGGAIKAHCIGSFMKGPHAIDIIRPGYDSQGRRRNGWTQFVHKGVPIFEVKMQKTLAVAQERFDTLWEKYIGAPNSELAFKALAAVHKERIEKFQDGKTGESAAPALTRDGRGDGKQYNT